MLASFLSVPVSLILVGGALYCLIKAVRAHKWVVRLNYSIHTLMALSMLGMAWHHIELPLFPQLLLFSIASFWFLLQAVSRHEFNLGCQDRSERLSCLYHAAMLAAMVFMLTLPHSAAPQQHLTAAVQNNGHASHTGHALTTAPAPVHEADALWTQPTTQVLAVLFAVAVLVWILPWGRNATKLQSRKEPGNSKPGRHRHLVLDRTYEAGAALSMSLMFAAVGLQA